MPEYLHDRHFTLEEARTLLPWVREQVETLVSAKRECDAQGFRVEKAHSDPGYHPNGGGSYPPAFRRLVAAAQALAGKGIRLKDPDTGLIDFPHIREGGEEVYLCWKLGDAGIAFWHRIADGFAGRQPIEKL